MDDQELNICADLRLLDCAWLKKLAIELVGDEGIAHDLAVNTLRLYGNQNRSAVKYKDSYMRAILRRLVSRYRLSEARRSNRERSAAQREAVKSPAEVLGDLETQKLLIDQMQLLDPGAREVLVLRFHQGLSAVEIGMRTGVPASTVRKRQGRALEELRVALERKFPDRQSWAMALIQWAGSDSIRTASVPLAKVGGAWAGSTLVLITLAKLLGMAALVAVALVIGMSDSLPAVDSVALLPEKGESVSLTVALHGESGDKGAGLPHEKLGARSVVEQSVAAQLFREVLVHGQVLLPTGKAASGAAVVLKRDEGSGTWGDIQGVVDRAGRFELTFSEEGKETGGLYTLIASYPDLEDTWVSGLRLDAESGRSELSVRTMVFDTPETCVLNVRIVDKEGGILTKDWVVSAKTGGGQIDHPGVLNPDLEVFRIEGLLAGDVAVSAKRGGLAVRKLFSRIPLEAWSETTTHLVYDGLALDRRIIVRIRQERRQGQDLGNCKITLLNEIGQTLATSVEPVKSRTYHFDDLEPGFYSIRIENERYEPWSMSGIRPGEQVDAHLSGNAAIHLRIVDRETGKLVRGARVWGESVYLVGTTQRVHQYKFQEGTEESDGSLHLPALVPGSLDLFAEVPGYPRGHAEVRELMPGEERVVVMKLGPAPALLVRVMEADGQTPAAGVEVECKMTSAPPRSSDALVLRSSAGPFGSVMSARTDDQGLLRFEGMAEMTYSLTATSGEYLSVQKVIHWSLDESPPVTLTLPPSGWLEGKLLLPIDRDLGDFSLMVQLEGEVRRIPPPGKGPASFNEPQFGPGGAFRIGPLPRGTMKLSLQLLNCDRDSLYLRGMVNLGQYVIEENGTTQARIDLRSNFLGSIGVRVLVDGVLQDSGTLHLNGGGRTNSRALGSPEGLTFSDVSLGQWHFAYTPSSEGWTHQSSQPITVSSGVHSEVTLRVFLDQRDLLFTDSQTGAPLRASTVTWRGEEVGGVPSQEWIVIPDLSTDENPREAPGRLSSTPLSLTRRAFTDSEGRLQLTLPRGRYRFYNGRVSERDAPHASVLWTGGAGDLEVALPGRRPGSEGSAEPGDSR
jgi:RNA polymerase sigma factor (sigma-70 family)